MTVATPAQSKITVYGALYIAVWAAIGNIASLFAIPVGPNIHVNLYVISGIAVGATMGPLAGFLAGFLGALYTIVLWGHPWATIFSGIYGLVVGWLCARKPGLRPTIVTILPAYLASTAWSLVSLYGPYSIMGLPMESFWLGRLTTFVQALAAGLIVDALLSSRRVRNMIPPYRIEVSEWVRKLPWLMNPAAQRN
jgi:uncharacterized membrane protein